MMERLYLEEEVKDRDKSG